MNINIYKQNHQSFYQELTASMTDSIHPTLHGTSAMYDVQINWVIHTDLWKGLTVPYLAIMQTILYIKTDINLRIKR